MLLSMVINYAVSGDQSGVAGVVVKVVITLSQVASRVLRLSPSRMVITESSTNTVPNTTPTAASVSSDIYGMAVKVGVVL